MSDILRAGLRGMRVVVDALAVAVLFVLVPAALIWLVGSPLPETVPSADLLHEWSRRPDPHRREINRFLVHLAALVLWLVWLGPAVAVAVTAVRRIRPLYRRAAAGLRRLPHPAPARLAATGVVGAVALTVPTAGSTAAPTVEPPVEPPTPPTGQPSSAGIVASVAIHLPGSVGTGARAVSLPDGCWSDGDLTAAIHAAAAATWVYRRRFYRPRPPRTAEGIRRELPAVDERVSAILHAVDTDEDPPVAPPAVAVRPSPGLLTLHGTGAHGAARAILLSALISPPTPVLCTKAAWMTLLGGTEAPGRAEIVADDSDLLEHLQRHLATAAARPARILAMTTLPAPAQQSAIRLVATLGAPLGLHTVVLGEWPDAPGWNVDRDGHTTDGRTSVLGTDTVRAVLELIDTTAAGVHHPDHAATARPSSAPPRISPERFRRPALRLRILGDILLHTTSDGLTEITVQRRAATQLLVLLAVHPAGMSTAALARLVWPGEPASVTTRRLYTAVSALRVTLRTATGVDVITRTGERYRYDPRHISIDWWQLTAAQRHAVEATTDDERTTALRAATDLYDGELATGEAWHWLPPYRETARRIAVDAYTALAAAEPAQALHLLDSALAVDPVNEEICRTVMRLHAGTRNLDAVSATMRTLARALAVHQQAPSSRTTDLAGQLLHG